MKLLIACIVVMAIPACGNKKTDWVGSYSGRCERDDTTPNKTDVDCAVDIGAPKDNVYPVHATAGSGEMTCDADAVLEDNGKTLAVTGKYRCSGLGSNAASWRMHFEDGQLSIRGLWLSAPPAIKFTGLLDRGETKALAARPSEAKPSAAAPPAPPMAPPTPPKP